MNIKKNIQVIASESSEQENYYRLFKKPEPETENPLDNDDNDGEDNSDVSPKLVLIFLYTISSNTIFTFLSKDYDIEEEDEEEGEDNGEKDEQSINSTIQETINNTSI